MNTAFEFCNTSYKKLYCGENCFSTALNTIITQQSFKNIFLFLQKAWLIQHIIKKLKKVYNLI
jgi:hypothetical protein